MEIVYVLLGLLLGAIGVYFYLDKQLQVLSKENIHLEVSLDEKIKSYENQINMINIAREQMSKDFKAVAGDILAKDRNELSIKNLELLTPLQSQLKEFRDKIEIITTEQIKERATLAAQIDNLKKTSIEAQQTTQNLTNALTYDNKQQGDWGEMILSSILSSSGLREGHEFDTQKQLKNEQGVSFKPDVILHLPDEKDIIIDSKVSLKAYKDYIADQSNATSLKAHVSSVEAHINGISIKEYENLEGVLTLDFIFVFIPIESALLVALDHKPDLFTIALKKNIVLVSPSTLMMSLKTVHHIWQTERQNLNSEEIARQAGAMYDKLFGFIKSMDDIEKHLDKAQKSYKEARSKLSEGKGNLIGRAEKLKALGVQSKKELN
ncbi:DNA recombination protein RmuC [Bathymodiolus heckerae thiotrophic gill symbiont]|uniref:DNA recombination protein RmuC n=1 Tax=Bathymodiolus heckerae thiotrophic gill symbiont TaxID=1052212 RepID=UPI0010B0F94A|nr:DNA recombination protein RmuC [Bathymodiolus heckerae thiotrophic gill symbiont]CAC9536919.1 DNA recombination protein RmuC [uncultured Gammaproteobacteria bacterium]CAC9590783.1 DNA recombination protein RmuC [uncultured Gammaproteobacteria bacterium]CAC9956823.1 DNA recombination protein RmuC [uncultured Gammaproteobacteria bacterium]SHN90107.1 DNA recombination protein RmuC [Bathymodiolus heckerae thiotrophic gill symbiont]